MKTPRRKKLSPRSVEFNLTEHCNLSCYSCDHASPLLPKKFASLESFSRDMTALARVLHARQFRVVGGEPLLHPRLLDFLSEARRIGIADETVLFTNATLLHKMPKRFYSLVDRIWVSIYPGVKRRVDWPECSKLCMDHGVTLDVRHYDEFIHTLVNHPIEDPALVAKVFSECRMVGELGCPSVHEGRFYSCCVAPFLAPRLALRGVRFDNRETDGVALHDNPRLYEEVESRLKSRSPLAACSYCLGSSGPMTAHRQLNGEGRTDWLKEDDRALIAATRKRLLASRPRR